MRLLRVPAPLFLLVALIPISAQQPAGSEATSEASISGKVVSRGDGRGLGGARVMLTHPGSGPRITYTRPGGSFRFLALGAGDFSVFVFKSGFREARSTVSVPDSRSKIVTEVAISRFAAISGEVFDSEGRPVTGAQVRAVQRKFDTGMPLWDGATGNAEDRTDDRGRYRLHGLMPGEYLVTVVPHTGPAIEGAMELLAAPAFYPNATELGSAGVVKLGWGTVREGANISLEPPANTVLRIEARDRKRQLSCAQCSFSIYSRAGGEQIFVTGGTLSEAGRVVLSGLPPGSYAVAVTRWSDERLHGRADAGVSENRSSGVLVEVHGEQEVLGSLIFDEKPGSAFNEDDRISIALRPVRGDPSAQQFFGKGRYTSFPIAKRQEFELKAVPGPTRVEVTDLPDGFYVSGMYVHGRPAGSSAVDFPPTEVPLLVRVASGTGKVFGRVELAEGGAASRLHDLVVRLWPRRPERGYEKQYSTRPNEDGSFRVENVAPGYYFAACAPSDAQYSPYDPLLRRTFGLRIVEVEVEKSAGVQVSLEAFDPQ